MQSILENSHRIFLLLNPGKYYPGVQHQSVRFGRKPRWVPMAKSKMYRIVDRPPPPLQETEEAKILMATYKLYSKSLWTFQKRISEEQEAKSESHAKDVSEEMELEKIFLETERDNAIVKALREKNLAEEWRLIKEGIVEKRDEHEEQEIQMLQITEQKIQAEMERLKTVIKQEDLDEAIEKALAMEVDYNFSIDKDGKVYKGRNNYNKGEGLSSSGPLTFQSSSSSTSSTTSATRAS